LYPPGKPRFIVVEGLSAVGKTTIAPLLAQAIGGVCLDTLALALDPARQYLDAQMSPAARVHFWMAANYLASDVVREALSGGQDVVIESYFFRTLATHAAMGVLDLPVVDWRTALAPHTVIELVLDEAVRQRRLTARDQSGRRRYWSDLEERQVAVTQQVYDACGLTRVDTTGMASAEVVQVVEQVLAAKDTAHAR
jgi:dTMP kinase